MTLTTEAFDLTECLFAKLVLTSFWSKKPAIFDLVFFFFANSGLAGFGSATTVAVCGFLAVLTSVRAFTHSGSIKFPILAFVWSILS